MTGLDWNTIVLAIIGLIGTLGTAVIALYTRQIHTAVNSERTATLNELRAVKAEVLKLTAEKATRDEREHPTPKRSRK